jgi:hypothetical protein
MPLLKRGRPGPDGGSRFKHSKLDLPARRTGRGGLDLA